MPAMSYADRLAAIVSGNGTLRAVAGVVPPRDRRPVFDPSHKGEPRAPHHRPLIELPEIECHEAIVMGECDGDVAMLSPCDI